MKVVYLTVLQAPGKESGGKGRRSSQSASPKLFKYPERSSSSTDPRREGSETALSSIQVPVKNQVNLATKVRNKRKIDLEKPQIIKDLKFSDETIRNHASAPFPSLHDRALDLKVKCLPFFVFPLTSFIKAYFCIISNAGKTF